MRQLLPLLALLAGLYFCVIATYPRPVPEPVIVEVPAAPQQDTLSEWEMLQLAIARTESRYRPEIVGSANDFGIYQIVPIYVKEINRLSGYEAFQHEDALHIGKSIEMFNVMQDFKNPGHDIDLAIRFHNKSEAYRRAVQDNYQVVLRYETLRKALIEYRKKQCSPSKSDPSSVSRMSSEAISQHSRRSCD